MKLRKIKILSALTIAASMLLASCSKDDGAIPERVNIEDVPAISTNLETGGTAANISVGNQAAFEGKFKISLFFPDAKAPAKVDMVVRKNGVNATAKLFKADVTSFPTSFTVTAAQINALFGTTTLALNDTYDFAPDIYVADKKYQAFPLVGLGNGQGITGMSSIGYGEFVRYSVK